MANMKKMLQIKGRQEHVLMVLLIIYILSGASTPQGFAKLVDTIWGNLFVAIVAIVLFTRVSPVVGIMGLIAAYEIVRRSSVKTGSGAIKKFVPSEIKKGNQMAAFNQTTVTLEEELVNSMVPLVSGRPCTNANYKPVLNDTHKATAL
jgi:hypothetical protein